GGRDESRPHAPGRHPTAARSTGHHRVAEWTTRGAYFRGPRTALLPGGTTAPRPGPAARRRRPRLSSDVRGTVRRPADAFPPRPGRHVPRPIGRPRAHQPLLRSARPEGVPGRPEGAPAPYLFGRAAPHPGEARHRLSGPRGGALVAVGAA